MYIRNIDAIFRLGFSPVLIEARAVAISEGISQIHDCHETWDILMEDVLWETKVRKKLIFNECFLKLCLIYKYLLYILVGKGSSGQFCNS